MEDPWVIRVAGGLEVGVRIRGDGFAEVGERCLQPVTTPESSIRSALLDQLFLLDRKRLPFRWWFASVLGRFSEDVIPLFRVASASLPAVVETCPDSEDFQTVTNVLSGKQVEQDGGARRLVSSPSQYRMYSTTMNGGTSIWAIYAVVDPPSYLIKHVKICNAPRRNAWRVGQIRSLNGNIKVFAP